MSTEEGEVQWFVVKPTPNPTKRARGSGSTAKEYNLDMRETTAISSSLSDKFDVSQAVALEINRIVVVSQGITPGHKGFVLSKAQAASLIAVEPNSASVVHQYLVGDDMLGNTGKAARALIDFGQKTIIEVQAFPKAFKHLQTQVLPAMEKVEADAISERATSIDRWWQHWRGRSALLIAIAKLPRYLVCSRVTKRPIFAFFNSEIRPGDALQAFALADDYSFGILQSKAHYLWFHAKCSNMKADPRYSSESIFHTFPWPQQPTDAKVRAVADTGITLRKLRDAASRATAGGLRNMYRTLDLPGKNPLKDAHDALDKAVLGAYGFSASKNLLQQLLDLNGVVATRITADKTVNGPGIPENVKKSATLISKDCIGI